MPETFAEIGIPFPLFEAPVKEAYEHRGAGRCVFCGATSPHCFAVAAAPFCPGCGPSDDARTCSRCLEPLPPPPASPSPLLCCHPCLRAGRGAIAKDTVLGMVGWQQAAAGLTHGLPGWLRPGGFELVPSVDDPEWLRARVPSGLLFELLRTPGYMTWQGERWQFCCGRPAVYLGEWKEDEFDRRAPGGGGEALLRQVDLDDLPDDQWTRLWKIGGPYVFRCAVCGRLVGHWDVD